MYSILNCNLVCIRNGAHVNKKKQLGEATHPLCLCLRLFHSHENMKAFARASNSEVARNHRLAVNSSCCRERKILELPSAIHVTLIHELTRQAFSKTACSLAHVHEHV